MLTRHDPAHEGRRRRTPGRRATRVAFGLVATLSLLVSFAQADGPDVLAHAVERASRRDPAGALSALDTLAPNDRTTPRALYLRARVEVSAGDLRAAVDSYRRAIELGLPSSIADEAVLTRALLLARTGRCAEALPIFAERGSRRDARGAIARAAEAECTLEVGAPADAVRALSAVVAEDAGPVDSVAARLALAEAYVRANERARAVSLLRETHLSRPVHRDAATVEARLRALDPNALVLTRDERLARVRKLADAGASATALEELDSLGKPRDRAALAAHLHLRGTILLSLRTRPLDASRDFAEAARLGGPTSVEDAFLAARALARADHDDEAIAAYDRFVHAHPSETRAEDAAFAAALLSIRSGHHGGERRLERFVTRRPTPSRTHLVEAERRLALDALDRRRPALALAHLARFRALEPEAKDAVDYFTARATEAKGDASAARALDRSLATRRPYTYYGLLSMQRLVAAGETAAPPPLQRDARTAPPVTLPEDVAFLASLGLVEEASDRLRSEESAVRAAAPTGRERDAVLAAYVAIGDAARAFELARGFGVEITGPSADVPGFVLDALYPRPFAEDVRQAVSPFPHVADAYVYATMRQESAYAPSALSHVGAIGLLQLMPSTGARVAARYGVDFDRALLFDPVWNVRLGVGEMERLCARFPALALVAAAYNAGEGRVVAWLGDERTVELDRFVEAIPFDETRRYVKRVLSHQAVYQALAGEPARGLAAVPLRVSWNR